MSMPENVKFSKNHTVDYDVMLQMLKDIIIVFDEFEVKWCVFGGTLIGAFRDKDFPFMKDKDDNIVYTDFDIDVFIFDISVNKVEVLAKAFIDIGYDAFHISSNPFNISKDSEWADIWRIDRSDINYYSSGGFPFHKKFFKNFEVSNIKDVIVPIPSFTDEFLDIYYTPSWRIPKKECGQFLDNKKLYERLIEREKKGI